MDTVIFARERERRIRAFVTRFPYVSTSVLCKYFFPFKSGRRKCLQVVQRMVAGDEVRRLPDGEHLFYAGKRSRQWKHMRDVTRFHFNVLFSLEKYSDLLYYKREVEYPGGRADALYIVGGDVNIKFFLEMDDGANKFDKVSKYMAYADSRKWQGEFWGRDGNFPLILIISLRLEEIADTIKRCKAEKFFRLMKKEKVYRDIIKQVSKNWEG